MQNTNMIRKLKGTFGSFIVAGAIVSATIGVTSVQADSVAVQPGSQPGSPAVLLETISQQVITILKKDHDLLQKEPNRVYGIIDEYVLPHLDEVTMAKLALGKNWKKATKKQKQVFVTEFKNLLVRTYSKSLLEFSDQKIKFFPVKLAAGTKKTSVKAEVIQPGGPSIPMSYRVRLKKNTWKVYDIKIDGISLVTSYRGTFTQEVRKSGMDGLLKYMHDKNSKLVEHDETKTKTES
ncbi:Uncharacterized ABC transporter, auxiliary component YrbC [hydrothermal vent metagenome]|uniref:Uncharacterized ABC transporter, auxiliary component YrbC n=1 Tax=hydrothermal vent metagenome TaxID=652676 RepID=A0A3B0WCK3_9ZZZZ